MRPLWPLSEKSRKGKGEYFSISKFWNIIKVKGFDQLIQSPTILVLFLEVFVWFCWALNRSAISARARILLDVVPTQCLDPAQVLESVDWSWLQWVLQCTQHCAACCPRLCFHLQHQEWLAWREAFFSGWDNARAEGCSYSGRGCRDAEPSDCLK